MLALLSVSIAIPVKAQLSSSKGRTSIENFSWLEGAWEGHLDVGDGFALAEVQYLAPKAETILGSFRLTKDGSVYVLELFSMTVVDEQIEMRIRHFSRTLDPWEKEDAIILTLESATDSLYTFRNHIHDSPRWSFLELLGSDQFRARSEIYSKEGEKSEIEILYTRRKSDT